MRLIDADALLDFLDVGHLIPPTEICFSELMMKNIIELMPTVDAVPVRHGKWTNHILGSTGYGTTVMHQCSECECMTISRFRYCPNCGARMDEE